MSRSAPPLSGIRTEVAKRRIESLGERFGKAHLYLAYHAAFPLALTPDLLYRLWANFQRDIHGKVLDIPWVAVADLLLSSLCNEVGHELYEMDGVIRNELVRRLKEDENFGSQRINELSDFLLDYVRQKLQSNDPDVRDFAQAQKWTALAYTRPGEAARELASALSRAYQQDKSELVRIAALVETLEEPLAEFKPMLVYASEMRSFARDHLEGSAARLYEVLEGSRQVQVAGVSLPIPIQIFKKTNKLTEAAVKSQPVKSNKAFSLLIVAFIVGILCAVALPVYLGFIKRVEPDSTIRSVNFSGKVGSRVGINLRLDRRLDARSLENVPYNATLNFDGWAYGQTVNDIWTGNPDALWFKVSGQNRWVPSAYINGYPPSKPPLQPTDCYGHSCIGRDPRDNKCDIVTKTITSTAGNFLNSEGKLTNFEVELRYSAKCDAGWSRSTAPSNSILYVEDPQGIKYGQYTIPNDGFSLHYSNMGPGKELRACIQLPDGKRICTD